MPPQGREVLRRGFGPGRSGRSGRSGRHWHPPGEAGRSTMRRHLMERCRRWHSRRVTMRAPFPCPSGGDLRPSPGAAARSAGRLHVGARLLYVGPWGQNCLRRFLAVPSGLAGRRFLCSAVRPQVEPGARFLYLSTDSTRYVERRQPAWPSGGPSGLPSGGLGPAPGAVPDQPCCRDRSADRCGGQHRGAGHPEGRDPLP